ncbi:undecaprenyl-diphosphate phosphatase [candidate division WOR-3 bacterium]|nr:undecaprenyl-diphosphate phosphatase [candidate division WOR-3 bacterium]
MVWKMLLLGVVQGVSEFLPISSSGHLLLGQVLLKVEGGLTIPIFLHVGTLIAVVVFMSRRIGRLFADMFNREKERRIAGWTLILYLFVASIPAALVGILTKDTIDRVMYGQPLYVAFFFVGTGALLLATRWGRERNQTFGISEALLIGIAQAVAILPGFSRSGLTIATALLLGIASVEAFEFSFLLSIPAIAGAALLEFVELHETGALFGFGSPAALIAGFLASAVVGFAALWIVKKVIVSRKFWLFSFYCFAVGVASLVLLLVFR